MCICIRLKIRLSSPSGWCYVFAVVVSEVGSAETGGSKETGQSSRQHTAELLRQTVSECVSRPNTLSTQHWPDPGRPDTSDDQDHHVPARVGYLATHKQQDPGSSGKTRCWSVSTSRSSTTHLSESRPERAESEKGWHLRSRIRGRSASQTSSDSQRSDHEGTAEQEGAEGDAKTAATSQVLPVFACLMSIPVTVRFWLIGSLTVDKLWITFMILDY